MNLIFSENSHWPKFLPLIVWVYLHSNLCNGLQKTRLSINDIGGCRRRQFFLAI